MRHRIIIIAIVFVGIITVSIGGFMLVQRSPQLQNTVAKLANVSVNTNTAVNATTNASVTNVDKQLVQLEATARVFTERYGSTTNQDPGALAAVLPYTSSRLRAIIQANIDDVTARARPDVAVVVETTVYVITPENVSATAASVTVSTVRQETVGTGKPKTTKQDLVLKCIREKNAWVIDQAQWKDAVPYGA